MKVDGGRGWVERTAEAGGGETPGVLGERVLAVGGVLGIAKGRGGGERRTRARRKRRRKRR